MQKKWRENAGSAGKAGKDKIKGLMIQLGTGTYWYLDWRRKRARGIQGTQEKIKFKESVLCTGKHKKIKA